MAVDWPGPVIMSAAVIILQSSAYVWMRRIGGAFGGCFDIHLYGDASLCGAGSGAVNKKQGLAPHWHHRFPLAIPAIPQDGSFYGQCGATESRAVSAPASASGLTGVCSARMLPL